MNNHNKQFTLLYSTKQTVYIKVSNRQFTLKYTHTQTVYTKVNGNCDIQDTL